ncbi:ATP-binding SpoIIE family protein phosphatase [Catalinimonas niigatensis]|uniref:ATP-binding SpoIIE family protein phosphatase n=1 Tax=Catalinimonas niigatensis TaxID=1397264 RepID=UPI0026670A06|nr:ATP-binding SpoIIE family protein phosphatase [Catalinimonas niigatensis]WPP49775.1 ATP-binding SpoIIE family protein phosphatase [Catalinimonas niigatensis]
MEQQLPSFDGRGSTSTGAYCRYRIEDRSYFSIIKKEITKEAEHLGFSSEKIGKIQIVVAELLTNLLKFGERSRELLWKSVWQKGAPGIEIMTLDKGPGIGSISQALEDGFSTSGTAGEGLGAIRRQSDFFEIYSQAGQGTVVLSRFFASEALHLKAPFHFAALSIAKPNENLCGDGYIIEYEPEHQLFNALILDGLGHGAGAYEASQAAIAAYTSLPKDSPELVLREIHQQIKKTRGAVAMALKYNFKEESLTYCGVGNISGKTTNYRTAKHLSSFNGIVGHVMSSRIHDQEIPWERGSLLFIHSDGLISRWDLAKYTQIQKYDPAILAACLYRDYKRGNDDTMIVICKHPSIDGKGTKADY